MHSVSEPQAQANTHLNTEPPLDAMPRGMRRELEPGLLSVFSMYIVVRLGVILGSGLIYFAWYGFSLDQALAPYVTLFVVDIAFLITFLSWPWLQRNLGRFYLPMALGVGSAIPIIEARYLYALYGDGNAARLWLVFPFLSVPLILIAWQYEYRHVVIYCLSTAVFETVLILTVQRPAARGIASEAEMILARSAFFVLVGYIVSNLVEAQRQQRQALAEANQKLVRYAATLEQLTISQERNRLARELHDTLAHTLAALAVQLEAIATVWQPIPQRAASMLDRALATTRSGLDETRRALQALRATPLEDLGLAQALYHLAEDVSQRGGLAIEVHIADRLPDLSPEVEQCFYRVAQEALENVAKHAGAQQVAVSLQQSDAQLILTISDDGGGFATDAIASEYRFGLQGMHERAALVSATLEITSSPGQGTIVRLQKEMSHHDSRFDL
jgi:signal transduction histidine kinase